MHTRPLDMEVELERQKQEEEEGKAELGTHDLSTRGLTVGASQFGTHAPHRTTLLFCVCVCAQIPHFLLFGVHVLPCRGTYIYAFLQLTWTHMFMLIIVQGVVHGDVTAADTMEVVAKFFMLGECCCRS